MMSPSPAGCGFLFFLTFRAKWIFQQLKKSKKAVKPKSGTYNQSRNEHDFPAQLNRTDLHYFFASLEKVTKRSSA